MNSKRQTIPNILLRQQRQLRGWSLQHVADQVCKLSEDDDRIPGVTADMVGKWERGEKKPSPFYQTRLCELYNTSADKLGFVNNPVFTEPQIPESQLTSYSFPIAAKQNTISGFPSNLHRLESLQGEIELSEELIANLLSMSSKQLAMLTTVGWTPQDMIAALAITLPGEAMMTKISRRQLFQVGTGMFLGSIALPECEHPTAEERTQLSDAIGTSIAASWSLFQNTNTAQVLAVGQAQLALLQQAHHTLYPNVRPMHYSAIYRLIGGALHFQGRYDEARLAHEKSYIAALEGADTWNMAQSLSWQADGLKAQEQYAPALDTLESAIRLASQQNNLESIRLQAHLFASAAEVAAHTGDIKTVETKLTTSERLLENLPPHEEFDRVSWHQVAGACALILGQYDEAIQHLQQAMNDLPTHWTLRHATTLMPLTLAYARKQERDATLAIAQKATSAISTINSPSMSKQFVAYLQQELLESFPADPHIQTIVTEAEQRLLPAGSTNG